MKIQILAAMACVLAMAAEGRAESVKSPDGKVEVIVGIDGGLHYAVSVDGKKVIDTSRMGMEFRGGSLGPRARVTTAENRSNDTTWENPFGKSRIVRDRFNELHLLMQEEGSRGFELLVRSYDDGVAFRYVIPEATAQALAKEGETIIDRELTEFTFAENYQAFAGRNGNGPGSFRGPQEWVFKPTLLGDITPNATVGLPLLVKAPNVWLALTESDLRNWAGLWLTGKSREEGGDAANTLVARLARRLDGQGAVKLTGAHRSPWRVLMIGRTPGALVESNLVLNLASPNEMGDTSWIKPGIMAWDHWWSGDLKMDTATIKQYITLAGEMGWPYQLIDWTWYGPYDKPTADITSVNPALNMDDVRRFAKDKGVRLWVWMHWTDVNRNDAYKKAFALYEQWGIAGVKIDFMDRDDQEMVNWYEKITKAAAEHHLMVNFHGAMKPTGFERAWPNQVTREGIFGNEQNRWSKLVTPEHKVMLPFTRYLAGPADFTPGGFQNRLPADFKADGKSTQVQGTRANELALFVVYDSPICCACDAPERYSNQPGADFLKVVPTVWEETRCLQGMPGEYIVLARRHKSANGDQWFLGGMTDSHDRRVSVPLEFLGDGDFTMELWRDAPDSSVNAEHLVRETQPVTEGEKLEVAMAPGGGFVARISKK